MSTTDERLDGLASDLGALSGRVDGLETGLDALHAQVTVIQHSVNEIHARIEPLTSFYRVTMETSRLNYAMGQAAEITAVVTDLHGERLDLPAAEMPWVDFVASWALRRAAASRTVRFRCKPMRMASPECGCVPSISRD